MFRIAVLDDFQRVARHSADWREIERVAKVVVFEDHVADAARLVERLQPFDVLCVMRERTALPAAVLRQLPRLRMIATTGGWNAAIDLACADQLGIVVSGTSSSETAAAELTWALILASARRLPSEVEAFRSGAWQNSVGLDLHGRTLGVLGLGLTGSRVAGYGKAFGMRVIAWSCNLTPERRRASR